MKKFIVTALIALVLLMVGCGKVEQNSIEREKTYYYAYITAPDGSVIEVDVDYALISSGRVIVNSIDGQRYSVSNINCMLTKEKWKH